MRHFHVDDGNESRRQTRWKCHWERVGCCRQPATYKWMSVKGVATQLLRMKINSERGVVFASWLTKNNWNNGSWRIVELLLNRCRSVRISVCRFIRLSVCCLQFVTPHLQFNNKCAIWRRSDETANFSTPHLCTPTFYHIRVENMRNFNAKTHLLKLNSRFNSL